MSAQPTPAPVPQPVPISEPIWKRLWKSRPARLITKFLLLPLIGALISGMVINRVTSKIFRPDKYFVYVVGDESDDATKQLLDAAYAKGQQFSFDLDGVPVKTEIRNDFGEPGRAQTIAQELASTPNTLMVIGHVFSTPTERALPVYLKADPPIPVILTTETYPALLPPQAPDDKRVPPVFRLFPTDNNQADMAARFIGNKGATAVWVVEDVSNPTYSHNLAQMFVDKLYSQRKAATRVVLQSNNLSLPPYAVERLGIDWVFFAGDWRPALVLIRQLNAIQGTKKPKVLLSDASADNSLLTYGGADVEGVYLLHPMPAKLFNEEGYVPVGKEARDLSEALIGEVHQDFETLAKEQAPVGYRIRSWLGLRRVSDARRALGQLMTTAVGSETFSLPDNALGKTVKMVKDDSNSVIRENADFHVWQVVKIGGDLKFADVP